MKIIYFKISVTFIITLHIHIPPIIEPLPPKANPFRQDFQDSKITFNCPPQERPLFHCRQDDLTTGGPTVYDRISLIYYQIPSLDLEGALWPWSYGSWIYNYLWNQWLSPLMLGVRLPLRARSTTLCDKVCHWLVAGQCFFPSRVLRFPPPKKTDRHNITEILLKVALNIINPTNLDIEVVMRFYYQS